MLVMALALVAPFAAGAKVYDRQTAQRRLEWLAEDLAEHVVPAIDENLRTALCEAMPAEPEMTCTEWLVREAATLGRAIANRNAAEVATFLETHAGQGIAWFLAYAPPGGMSRCAAVLAAVSNPPSADLIGLCRREDLARLFTRLLSGDLGELSIADVPDFAAQLAGGATVGTFRVKHDAATRRLWLEQINVAPAVKIGFNLATRQILLSYGTSEDASVRIKIDLTDAADRATDVRYEWTSGTAADQRLRLRFLEGAWEGEVNVSVDRLASTADNLVTFMSGAEAWDDLTDDPPVPKLRIAAILKTAAASARNAAECTSALQMLEWMTQVDVAFAGAASAALAACGPVDAKLRREVEAEIRRWLVAWTRAVVRASFARFQPLIRHARAAVQRGDTVAAGRFALATVAWAQLRTIEDSAGERAGDTEARRTLQAVLEAIVEHPEDPQRPLTLVREALRRRVHAWIDVGLAKYLETFSVEQVAPLVALVHDLVDVATASPVDRGRLRMQFQARLEAAREPKEDERWAPKDFVGALTSGTPGGALALRQLPSYRTTAWFNEDGIDEERSTPDTTPSAWDEKNVTVRGSFASPGSLWWPPDDPPPVPASTLGNGPSPQDVARVRLQLFAQEDLREVVQKNPSCWLAHGDCQLWGAFSLGFQLEALALIDVGESRVSETGALDMQDVIVANLQLLEHRWFSLDFGTFVTGGLRALGVTPAQLANEADDAPEQPAAEFRFAWGLYLGLSETVKIGVIHAYYPTTRSDGDRVESAAFLSYQLLDLLDIVGLGQ